MIFDLRYALPVIHQKKLSKTVAFKDLYNQPLVLHKQSTR